MSGADPFSQITQQGAQAVEQGAQAVEQGAQSVQQGAQQFRKPSGQGLPSGLPGMGR